MNTTTMAAAAATTARGTAGLGRRDAVQGTVLESVDLTKRFGGNTVVDGLTFEMRSGEVLGFLGPNGAGKSTTVGMILGLIEPNRGTIKIAGKPLGSEPGLVAGQIGAIIENPAFYPYLTGRDNLRAFGMMTGGVGDARIDDLLKLVNMHDRADRPFKTFSLGMKQRLGIAATLLTDPSIVILDEPTNGLDPAGQREIRAIIPRLAQEGHAVLLASHLLNEVEQVSDRVAIIRRGKLIQEGRVDDLLRSGGFIEVIVPAGEAAGAARALGALPFVERIDADESMLRVVAPDDAGGAINRALVEHGIYASGIAIRRHSLEDLFLDLTEENAPAEAVSPAGR
ncbi:MAG: ABC transporter ATP-binding protein [Thermomicrobiales bacterium]|nr:ABC transporter ATP-binding protein [Thermomicrobiales bacterium]